MDGEKQMVDANGRGTWNIIIKWWEKGANSWLAP